MKPIVPDVSFLVLNMTRS